MDKNVNILSKKITSFQVLRGIAFLGIFLEHAGIIPLGPWGVSIFIILSGFCLEMKYSDTQLEIGFGENIQFAFHRIKKLYILHVLTGSVIFVNLLRVFVQTGIYDNLEQTVIGTILNFLLLQSWMPYEWAYASLNSVSWYLSTVLFLYLCYPFLHSFVKKRTKNTFVWVACILLAFAVLEIVLKYVPMDIYWITYIFPPIRIFEFLVGCFLFYCSEHIKKGTPFILLSICVMISYIASVLVIPQMSLKYALIAVVSAIVVLGFSKWNVSDSSILRPIEYLGNISAECFLIHYVVLMFIGVYLQKYTNNKFYLAGICLGITIVLAIFYRKLKGCIR